MGKLGSGVLGSKHAQLGLLELGGLFQPEGIAHAALEAHGLLRGRGRIYGLDLGMTYISPRGRTKLFRQFKGTTEVGTPETVLPNPYVKS